MVTFLELCAYDRLNKNVFTTKSAVRTDICLILQASRRTYTQEYETPLHISVLLRFLCSHLALSGLILEAYSGFEEFRLYTKTKREFGGLK